MRELLDIEVKISNAMAESYRKAWDSLARYKFLMFGYWAAQWVTLNKLLPKPRPNPFRELVEHAQTRPDLSQRILDSLHENQVNEEL